MLVLSLLSHLSAASPSVQTIALLIFRVGFPSQSSSSIPQVRAQSFESVGNLYPMYFSIRNNWHGIQPLHSQSARLATPHWTAKDTEDGTTSAISWEQASLGLLLPSSAHHLLNFLGWLVSFDVTGPFKDGILLKVEMLLTLRKSTCIFTKTS